MIICTKCKKKLLCEKNGVTVRYLVAHNYAGDKYKCPSCNTEMILTNDNPYHSDHAIDENNGDILME